MKKICLLLATIVALANVQAQQSKNVVFKGRLKYPGIKLANIWGYVDKSGNEYALVGTSQGLSIVDVTNPATPVQKFTVTGPNSTWREVKTWGDYAYVTTEGGGGLAIVDLSKLPASVKDTVWKGDGAIAGQLSSIHALHIEDGFAYLYGSNLGNKGAYVADLSNPWIPTYVGKYDASYIHDGYVRNDTMYAGHIYLGYFTVVDFSDKANPVLLATQNTPGNFTHNTWLTSNSRVLLTTDEISNSYLTAYDISDLSDIKELDRIQSNPGSNSAVHNTHVLNDYAVTSWYRDGFTIVDANRPDNLVQVGHYDTSPLTGGGFNGCWGVYPFFPSGTIVASDIDSGLYVFSPTYVRGCYLEGIVTDSVTGNPINNVKVEIAATGVVKYSKLNGSYKTGFADAGTYTVTFSDPKYYPRTISGISLSSGNVTALNVKMVPRPTFSVNGKVVKSSDNSPVPGAFVRVKNNDFNYDLTTDGSGNFTISGFIGGSYDITAGKWLYRTKCTTSQNIDSTTGVVTIALDAAIYDDFTFDYGWVSTGSATLGKWVKGEPVGTAFGNDKANPDLDVTGDCGDECYITGNNGGSAGTDDVDDGNAVLTSPVFDLTSYTDPFINYYRWFFNGGGSGNPDDTLTIKISNGTTTKLLDRVTASNPNWVKRFYKVSNYLTPTATMTLIVETADWPGSGHIVEAGLDHFEVTNGSPLGVFYPEEDADLQVFPNPFADELTIQYKGSGAGTITLTLTDLIGRVVSIIELDDESGKVSVPTAHLHPGLYFVTLRSRGGIARVIKAVKSE